jgi:DNA polymerase-3 subunit gamma/tau
LNISNQCDLNYKTSKNQRLQVELTLIKLCHIPAAVNLSTAGIPAIQDGQLKKKLNPVEEPPASEPILPIQEITTPIQVIVSEPILQESVVEDLVVSGSQEPIVEETVVEETAVKIIIPKLSAGTNSSLIPNLNDLEANYSKKEEIQAAYLIGESKLEFSSDSMLKFWNAYAEKIKKEGKINIFTIMTANPPVLLDEFIIELLIENKIQEDLLSSEKVDLLNYLRVEMKNFSIDLQTRYMEQTQKKRLYTSSDKYQHMLEKNPNLEEFKRRFNLDLDY